ncbi:flagellar biosynthetic protein FliO [Cytobacillus sp. FSL K6-0265]|uniref:Flagellar biosynthetic protein FliO n=1 Tax=Cytobacillus stercorigallinarum TaxID=2762240 RepID=A0ABR8QMH4_9BACI|nr:flagellar biosynthetic protein FliO [Cytobacillus stercorigallinarum]
MNMYKQVIGRICLLTISCLFLTQLLIVTASAESRSVEEMVNDEEKSAETNEVEQDIDSEEITADTTDVGLSAWDFIKMIFATVFVVALLYGLLKFVNKKSRSYKSTNVVNHLGGTALGQNRSVQVVKIGEKVYILGVGENVQLISEVADKEERETLLKHYEEQGEQSLPARQFLTQPFKIMKKSESEQVKNQSFQDILSKQLADMKKTRSDQLDKVKKKGNHEHE